MLLVAAALVAPRIAYSGEGEGFDVVETTIADIQHAFCSEDLTPEQLVRIYLARIAAYDQSGPQLNSYMHVNERAIEAARALRTEDCDEQHGQGEGQRRRPLFGVPVILKDNIDTSDMPTPAGPVALGASIPPHDA